MPNRGPNRISDRRSAAGRRGMTLIELLAVIAVIAIMLGLLAPAIGSFASTAGRKAAVTKLMNTFEQARVAALESGANVFVILRQRTYPLQDSVMVVREKLEWDDPAAPDVIQLTKWMELPEGVILYGVNGTLVPDGGTAPRPSKLPGSYTPPAMETGDALSFLQFNPSGAIAFPQGNNLQLFVTEGVRGEGQARLSGFERIGFARYTGRALLDVTETTANL